MNLEEVEDLLINNRYINNILQIIQAQDLQDAWLCAGTIRNFIWNYLSNNSNFDQATDVDVVFYDPQITYEETLKMEQQLKRAYPEYEWELKNEVYMHPIILIQNHMKVPETPFQNFLNVAQLLALG